MSVLGKRDRNHNKEGQTLEYDSISAPKQKKHKSSAEIETTYDSLRQNNRLIVLDVGGIRYKTTIQTLTGYDSILKARFSSQFAMIPEEDGSYFIDRNGAMFEYILKYLRTGQLLLPETWTKQDIWEFYIDTKYYMVQSLFAPTLLKLFDSKLITNHTQKLQIIDKLSEVSNCNKSKIMENVKGWKLIYDFSELSDSSNMKEETIWAIQELYLAVKCCLILIRSEYNIYGICIKLFRTKDVHFGESFAFDCGPFSAYNNNDDLDIEFEAIRKATEEEKAYDEAYYDDYLSDYYPLIMRRTKEKYRRFFGCFGMKYFDQDDGWKGVLNMEMWSINV